MAELRLIKRAHQNMEPALPAKLRALAAGTTSMAVTKKTPKASTENITKRASRPAKIYCKKAVGTR